MNTRTSTPNSNKSVPSGNLISLTEAAQNLSVSVKTIRRRIADGTVRAYRVGRLIRIDADELRTALLIRIPGAR
ncbi:excisionase family DNA-binding protein [Myceligenerans xiligouense]|uniref:Excisionase family DNA binding protein n=1 Tax=Myceligenerans xiligouense TaxID=253184 RepID=A0A3N4Z6H5_9MICO|nr:excisionase family DNA-binding protein [Myceligenerans xiligouense]RPF21428.1 excisionase family DNA binding protein [Myceligenerans xiligouense]